MPDFIEFDRDDSRSRREDPQFTLQARGLLSLNLAAFRALSEPEAVTLLYDAKAGIVALRKVEKAHENAYRVRKQQKSQSYLVGAQGFTAYHGIQTLRARRFIGHDYNNGVWGFVLREGVAVTNRRGAEQRPAMTGRWTPTTDGSRVAALVRIGDVAMSHPGLMRAYDKKPPSMRIGALVACDALGADPPTSELRSLFLAFLQQEQVTDLVETAIGQSAYGAEWTPYAGRGRINHEAVLTTENIQDTEPPAASALMLLPEGGTSSFGRDPRFAELVLDVELRRPDDTPALPATLGTWHSRFVQMYNLPSLFAQFLTSDLGLTTSADPPTQLGVWLKTRHSMLEIVDIGNLPTLQGAHSSSWFTAYSIADPLGHDPVTAAAELLRQMCDYTLSVDKYEPVLAALVNRYADGRNSALKTMVTGSASLTNEARDAFIAPELSEFTTADIKNLSSIVAGQNQWLRSYLLNSTLRGAYQGTVKPMAYNFLRRADSSIREYRLARERTLEYLANSDLISAYFAAVGHWEIVLSHLYQALCLLDMGKKQLFKPDEDSPVRRLNLLYGRTKHLEKAIASEQQLPDNGDLPVWLKNDGLHSTDAHLTFAEIVQLLEAIAQAADALQDPLTVNEKLTQAKSVDD